MEKSALQVASRPNWYRGIQEKPAGDYFGSLSSLYPDEVFVTHDKKWIVSRMQSGEVSVVQNVCLHAGMEILNTPGTQHSKEIRCSGHQFLYDMRGKLLTAPKFCKLERSLLRPPFSIWNGYVIGYSAEELQALDGFGSSLGLPQDFLSAESFWFGKEIEYSLPYPRILMKINYDDGLHVPVYHRFTFGTMVDEREYDWEFGPEDTNCSYSIQVVKIRPDIRAHVDRLMHAHQKNLSELGWADFHFWLEEKMPNVKTPIDKEIFAVWASIYGNGYMMPELFFGGRFLAMSYLVSKDGSDNIYRTVSYTDSNGDQQVKTENNLWNYVEFYIHKSVPEALRDVALEKFIFAYEQSAREDDELCEKLWSAHRRDDLLFDRIVHDQLEAGEAHFRNWLLDQSPQK